MQIPNDRGISTIFDIIFNKPPKFYGDNIIIEEQKELANKNSNKIDKNKFVDFCNGDVKGEDTETLNHFDEHTRYQFTRMLYAYGTGMTGQNPFANDEEVEITADIDSATHTSF